VVSLTLQPFAPWEEAAGFA